MKPDIKRRCVLIRSGLELWISEERAKRLIAVMNLPNPPRFIEIEGQYVNSFEIRDILTPDAMEDRQRYKNGQWKCMKSKWHEKGHVCECKEYKETVKAHVEGYGEITYKR